MCYAGGQIWGAGLRKSSANHGESNKTELPRGPAQNGKRVIRMEPHSFFPKWNAKVKNQARPIAVQYAEAMEPFWEEMARWLDETFGALYRPVHDSHKQARESRTTNCLQQYRNVLRINTPYFNGY